MTRSRYLVLGLLLAVSALQLRAGDSAQKRAFEPIHMPKITVSMLGTLPGGSYTVGLGGYFPTLDSAFARLGSGIAGAITLELTDSLYTPSPEGSGWFGLGGPIEGTDSAQRITIRPAANHIVTLRGSGEAVLMINNASYVTVDGIAVSGPTQLKIDALTNIAHKFNDGIDVTGNSDNVIIRNVLFTANDVRGSNAIGLWGLPAGAPDACVVEDNIIRTGFYGIYVSSSTDGAHRPSGLIIARNQIGTPTDSIMAMGIQAVEIDKGIIEGNHVQHLRLVYAGPSRGHQVGINAYHCAETMIRNNTVHDLSINQANTVVEGILASGDAGADGSGIWIYNNVIYDIHCLSGTQTAVAGIRSWHNHYVTCDNNSISLSSTGDLAPGYGSAAIWYDNTSLSPLVRNNILINVRSRPGEQAWAMRMDQFGSMSDHNDMYVPPGTTARMVIRNGSPFATLAEWQATGNDQSSVNVLPVFKDSSLHIDNTSAQNALLDAHGMPVQGLLTDFDGQPRSTLAPDIGAYEFTMPVLTKFGRDWAKKPVDAVLGGIPGSWFIHAFNPCVIYNQDSARFEMWFNGTINSNAASLPHEVGYATSKDGISWAIRLTPVMSPTPGTWDANTIYAPRVIRENGSYKMWYATYSSGTAPGYIGYATSPDGIVWTKYAGNPIFGPGVSPWEAGGPGTCFVMPVDGGYNIWYAASNAYFKQGSIGFATSADGIHWVRDSLHNPILGPGAGGAWDDYFAGWPVVLRLKTEDGTDAYFMWYVGSMSNEYYRSGLAVSRDGVTGWVKEATNPVLTVSSGKWDESYAGICSVLLKDSTLHAWYDGSRDPVYLNRMRIGHAWSTITSVDLERITWILPQQFAVSQNYPNPFNPSTTIQFAITRSAPTDLFIYDILGREVDHLVNEVLAPGTYKVQWDSHGVASGVYFYRLRSGEYTDTKRMLLLK